MPLLEALIYMYGGMLTKFGNYSMRVSMPYDTSKDRIASVLSVAREDYGEDDLIICIDLTETSYEISFFIRSAIFIDASKIASPYGLVVEIVEDLFSIATGEDKCPCSLAINLIGPFPGNEVFKNISETLMSALPVKLITHEEFGPS